MIIENQAKSNAFRLIFASEEKLLSFERKAVGALVNRGVALVRADFYLIQRAVVFRAAMIVAGVNAALDGLVCLAMRMIHFA